MSIVNIAFIFFLSLVITIALTRIVEAVIFSVVVTCMKIKYAINHTTEYSLTPYEYLLFIFRAMWYAFISYLCYDIEYFELGDKIYYPLWRIENNDKEKHLQ